jgi:hypothetical protein
MSASTDYYLTFYHALYSLNHLYCMLSINFIFSKGTQIIKIAINYLKNLKEKHQ